MASLGYNSNSLTAAFPLIAKIFDALLFIDASHQRTNMAQGRF